MSFFLFEFDIATTKIGAREIKIDRHRDFLFEENIDVPRFVQSQISLCLFGKINEGMMEKIVCDLRVQECPFFFCILLPLRSPTQSVDNPIGILESSRTRPPDPGIPGRDTMGMG